MAYPGPQLPNGTETELVKFDSVGGGLDQFNLASAADSTLVVDSSGTIFDGDCLHLNWDWDGTVGDADYEYEITINNWN